MSGTSLSSSGVRRYTTHQDSGESSDESAQYGSYTIEERLHTRHDVRKALRQLPLYQRALVALMQRYAVPPGYTGPWPPTPEQIGAYMGATFPRFRGKPISAGAVVRINLYALRTLRRWLEERGVTHGS